MATSRQGVEPLIYRIENIVIRLDIIGYCLFQVNFLR